MRSQNAILSAHAKLGREIFAKKGPQKLVSQKNTWNDDDDDDDDGDDDDDDGGGGGGCGGRCGGL